MKLNEGITFALLIWNLIIFLIYGIDKFKAQRGAWRIPENIYYHLHSFVVALVPG